MNKKGALKIILGLIFLVLFNFIFFIFGGAYSGPAGWISYGFITFSYIMLIISSLLGGKGPDAALLKLPLAAVSFVYFIVCLIVGVFFLILGMAAVRASLVVFVVITAVYAVFFISHLIANDNTEQDLERAQYERQYVKETSAKLKSASNLAADRALMKSIESVLSIVHSSPTHSSPAAREYEINVMNAADDLERYVESGNIEAAQRCLEEIRKNALKRNTVLKENA